MFHRATFPRRFFRSIGAAGLQPGHPQRSEQVRLSTIASHVNCSPSTVHPDEHLHKCFLFVPGITSFMFTSGSAHSSMSFCPYSLLSWHHLSRLCASVGTFPAQPGHPARLVLVRLFTGASHVNGSPSNVQPVEHLHSALYVGLPLVTSSTVLSGSYHSSISLSPYSPFSSHHSPSVMRRALTGAHGLEVEPRPLNNGDALLGLRASAPGRIGGAGATHRAAMTTMPLEQSPNPDGGVGRVSRAATSDATSEGQI